MAITSGVRSVRATITIGGQAFIIHKGTVTQNATRSNSTFSVSCALNSFPGGDRFFSGLSDNSCTIQVNGNVLLSGEIDTADIHYRGTEVKLEGRDKGVALQNTKSNEAFKNQTHSEVVQTIAQNVGLSANISGVSSDLAGKKFSMDFVKLTDGTSYADVLHQMAAQDGARWNITPDGQLNYYAGSASQGGGGYQIVFQAGANSPNRANFIDLEIQVNLQAAKALTGSASSFDSSTKKVVTDTKTVPALSGGAGGTLSSVGSASTPSGGQAGGTSGQGLTFKIRADQTDQQHLGDINKNNLQDAANQTIVLIATMVGDPAADVTQPVTLQGTGFDSAGPFAVEEIFHEFGVHEGWIMMIKAHSAGAGRTAS